MASALRSPKYSSVMEKFSEKKCVFIIDECHRSQFGTMHANIKKNFKNSNYIGFTGTPIFEENKGNKKKTTADVFKSGSLNPCIHKYTIKEAIADGNVLRFSVEYIRSVSVNKINIKGIDVNSLEDADYCKRHHIDIDELYHSDERIEMVSNDIMSHLRQKTRL
jgi:type I restriction enzyme R subunit